MAELLRAAWTNLPKEMIEAGHAFGFSGWRLFRRIILPPVIFSALPLDRQSADPDRQGQRLPDHHRGGRADARGDLACRPFISCRSRPSSPRSPCTGSLAWPSKARSALPTVWPRSGADASHATARFNRRAGAATSRRWCLRSAACRRTSARIRCCATSASRSTRRKRSASSGPSGAGKSTLLRCMNWLEQPDGGAVYLAGQRIGVRPGSNLRMTRSRSCRHSHPDRHGFPAFRAMAALDRACRT